MIPTLMYHSIDDEVDAKIVITNELFERQIKTLKLEGFSSVSINDYLNIVMSCDNELAKNKILITFDDGYQDFYTNAFPVLQKYNFTAINFLLTGYIGQLNWWNAKATYLKRHLNWNQISELSKYNFDFGSHSTCHHNMIKLSNSWIYNDLAVNKNEIEEHIERNVISFSFPYGDFREDTLATISSLFKLAFSVEQGGWDPINSMFSINRFSVNKKWDEKKMLLNLRKQ